MEYYNISTRCVTILEIFNKLVFLALACLNQYTEQLNLDYIIIMQDLKLLVLALSYLYYRTNVNSIH